jgi:hypothetical protein
MHPILTSPARLTAYLAAWVPLAIVLAALLAGPGAFSLGESVVIALPLALAFAFLGLAAWYPCKSAPLGRAGWLRLATTHGVAALITSAVWVFLGGAIARLLSGLRPFSDLADRYAAQVRPLFAAGVLLYLLSVALHYVLLSFEAAREAEQREASQALFAREAQLTALKAQIQPHFLFNSLNSISALVGNDPARAREMCVGLADFLRKSLAVGDRRAIRVSEEITLARGYLDVERIRFGKRLAVEEQIDPAGAECLVPPLLLQPLIENAVVHGIATMVEGGLVRLEASRTGHRLRIVVENSFDPDAPPKRRGGLGLKIVRERLTAFYGEEAFFAAKRVDGRHLAVISIPAQA